MVRNLIFDFDGTLVDTAPLIVKTMHSAIRELGLTEKTDEECRSTIGIRLEDIPQVLWPEVENLSLSFAGTYRRIFNELKRPLSVKCFPEVIDSLRSFHEQGYRMAIASSRSHASLEEYVEMFQLNDCFSMLIGGNDVKQGKPAPDPVLAIITAQHWKTDETLTIGDAPVDILMGKAAGTLTCAVTYGNSTLEALSAVNPNYVIDTFGSLRDILS